MKLRIWIAISFYFPTYFSYKRNEYVQKRISGEIFSIMSTQIKE